MVYDDLG